MKSNRDVAQGWLRKAESDLVNAELCLAAGKALDTACFHCQQAAEKALKAYLIFHGVAFPFVHDLEKLVKLCIARDQGFAVLSTAAVTLTPYAVALRYDQEFWPTTDEVTRAVAAAKKIARLAAERMLP